MLLKYASVVSQDFVIIALTIATLNDLYLLSYEIKNVYITMECRKKIYTIVGKEFGPKEGYIMIVNMTLYGLKSSCAEFRAKLAAGIHKLNYRPSQPDSYVCSRPATKSNRFEYYELVLCYVHNLLVITEIKYYTIQGLQWSLRMKDNKAEEPKINLESNIGVI